MSKIRKHSGFKQKFLNSINDDPKKVDGMYDVELSNGIFKMNTTKLTYPYQT